MSSKLSNNNPILCPIKGKISAFCSRTRRRNQFSSLSEYVYPLVSAKLNKYGEKLLEIPQKIKATELRELQ